MGGSIETYFSEDNPMYLFETIHKRSNKMLSDFLERLAVVVRKIRSIHTVYFHKLSRFDGEFVDVYYSEELKYARSVGYKVIPLSSYMFQNMNPGSPFGEFVGSLFESRLKARKEGNDSMAYVYKILMNSLYGRFGINPESTQTEVYNYDKYNKLVMTTGFHYAEKLSDEYYIVVYKNNTEWVPDMQWRPPRITTVHIWAAITTCTRIHMYHYISREDCYYTDTDSVVHGSPLPDDDVSPTELGKFKLEHKLNKAIFLAPKGYSLWIDKNQNLTKHKGLAKPLVSDKWYETQYADLKLSIVAPVDSNFQINWATLDIMKKTKLVKLSTPTNTKREPVYDNNQDWVDTNPVNVKDYAR
nr:PREDICTED: DNA polymerase-like [Nicotiana tabacum]